MAKFEMITYLKDGYYVGDILKDDIIIYQLTSGYRQKKDAERIMADLISFWKYEIEIYEEWLYKHK